MKTKIGTEVAHVTRDSDTTFKVKRSKVKGHGHQAALLTAVLARQAAAAVGVGTCWPSETAVTLPSTRPREALRRQRGRGRGISWRPPAYSLLVMWSETVGLRTRPVCDQIIGLGLGLAGLVLCCETRSCYARRHNDLGRTQQLFKYYL